MKAILNNVIVDPIKEEIEDSNGMIVSRQKSEKIAKGKVLSIGEQVDNVEVGDIAYYDKNRATDIYLDDKKVKLLNILHIFVKE